MFTAETLNADGVFFDYKTLNEILARMLAGSDDPLRDEIRFAKEISREITERDSVLYYGKTVVGGIIDELDDA